MTKFTFEIDVYSDTICPWCYIGKKALDNAIATYTAQHPDAEFKLTWKPYMLWPHARVSGMQALHRTGLGLWWAQDYPSSPEGWPVRAFN
jgi:predicted DsbA family dithiol-disulfide isomerase